MSPSVFTLEPEKQTDFLILWLTFYNMSDNEVKVFTTRQILSWTI